MKSSEIDLGGYIRNFTKANCFKTRPILKALLLRDVFFLLLDNKTSYISSWSWLPMDRIPLSVIIYPAAVIGWLITINVTCHLILFRLVLVNGLTRPWLLLIWWYETILKIAITILRVSCRDRNWCLTQIATHVFFEHKMT